MDAEVENPAVIRLRVTTARRINRPLRANVSGNQLPGNPVSITIAPMHSPVLRAIGIAWLVAGCLDITSAIVIWLMRGVPLVRGFQGIAAGLVGRQSAVHGGLTTAMLGFGLHFFIMFGVVIVFYLASRTFPALSRRPIEIGALYGVIVYLVMYWIVVPISRIGPRLHSVSNDATAILIHIFLIGLPIALIVSHFLPAKTRSTHA